MPATNKKEKAFREIDLDWLRVLATLAVFLYHSSRFFNLSDWHVKNNELSCGLHVFVIFTGQWLMPLFFVMSAVGAWHALTYRRWIKFIVERFKRLVVPLVFGTIVLLIPVQVYIERVSHGDYSGSFLSFYPEYFNGFYAFGGNFAWMGLHLWYLEMLFVFSLITLPLLLLLQHKHCRKTISNIIGMLNFPFGFLLPVLIIFLMEYYMNVNIETFGRREFGGWSLFTYLVIFICGYVFMPDKTYRNMLINNRMLSLITGIAAFFTGFLLFRQGFSEHLTLYSFIRSLNSWTWLSAIFGFASFYLTESNRLLTHTHQGVMPFYVLHQTVIVVLGFVLAGLPLSIPFKFLILVLGSFAVIMGLYETVIKRCRILRILFGMKGHKDVLEII